MSAWFSFCIWKLALEEIQISLPRRGTCGRHAPGIATFKPLWRQPAPSCSHTPSRLGRGREVLRSCTPLLPRQSGSLDVPNSWLPEKPDKVLTPQVERYISFMALNGQRPSLLTKEIEGVEKRITGLFFPFIGIEMIRALWFETFKACSASVLDYSWSRS